VFYASNQEIPDIYFVGIDISDGNLIHHPVHLNDYVILKGTRSDDIRWANLVRTLLFHYDLFDRSKRHSQSHVAKHV